MRALGVSGVVALGVLFLGCSKQPRSSQGERDAGLTRIGATKSTTVGPIVRFNPKLSYNATLKRLELESEVATSLPHVEGGVYGVSFAAAALLSVDGGAATYIPISSREPNQLVLLAGTVSQSSFQLRVTFDVSEISSESLTRGDLRVYLAYGEYVEIYQAEIRRRR